MGKTIIDKVALSKEGKKLGVISRVYGNNKNIVLARKEHAVITIGKKEDKIAIQLPTEKISKVTAKEVTFTISKKEFKRLLAKAKHEKKAKGIEARQRLEQEQAMDKAIIKDSNMRPRI